MDTKDLLSHLELTAKQANCIHDWHGKANQVCVLCGKKYNAVNVIVRDGSFKSEKLHKHKFVRLNKHWMICLSCDKKEKIEI